MTNLSADKRAKIIEVLCGQALADHLGDVREAETKLWELLGISRSRIVTEFSTAFRNTKATLERNGYQLPEYLRDEDEPT